MSKRTALLVGCNYRGTPYELHGCILDVYNMDNMLRTTFSFQTTILTDDSVVKPTRSNILAALNKIVTEAVSGDVVMFHYSGHGTLVHDTNGDEPTGQDCAIVPLDLAMVSDDELRAVVSKAALGVRLIALLDCCHSGTGFDLRYVLREVNYRALDPTVFATLEYPETNADIVMISGCRDSQTSAEAPVDGGKVQGALTVCFVRELEKSGYSISWRNLLRNVYTRLRDNAYDQIPQLSSGRGMDPDSNVWLDVNPLPPPTTLPPAPLPEEVVLPPPPKPPVVSPPKPPAKPSAKPPKKPVSKPPKKPTPKPPARRVLPLKGVKKQLPKKAPLKRR